MTTRRGFTLIEIMIAVTILLIIMGAAVQFLRRQTNAVGMESQRMEALGNAQFAATQIERELREAGAGVADAQPMLVQLDTKALTFNANLVSRDPADMFAVYRMPDADPNAVRSMTSSERLPLPNSTPPRYYPDSNYMSASGVPSGAETISYYLTRDASASTDSTFSLWRRVNAVAPTLVARNIVRRSGDSIPFFTYFKQDTLGRLVAIDPGLLPVYHGALHGISSDTGRAALADSVRAVRLHFVALTVDRQAGRDSLKYRVVETRVRLMNAGLVQLSMCGAKPLAVPAPAVSQPAPSTNQHAVTITWVRSADDGLGEKDIERYAIFRRAAGGTQIGDPIGSIPASSAASYSYVDTGVQPGTAYVYGIAAQDCTPSMSDVALSVPIIVNP